MYEMNTFFAILIPLIFLLTFLYAGVKKVRIFNEFTAGASKAIPLIVSIFPYIAAITILARLLTASGLEERILALLSPLFRGLGIPQEIAGLVLIKPLSGSGSIAMLSEILSRYGVDSYVARCACVAYGAAETIFYVAAVYFAGVKRKKLPLALFFSLIAYFLSVVVCCLLCRIL
jgi:spore maturation protein B